MDAVTLLALPMLSLKRSRSDLSLPRAFATIVCPGETVADTFYGLGIGNHPQRDPKVRKQDPNKRGMPCTQNMLLA